jgi:DNA-directed RNA polymerase subunit RPC12/RpoP
MESNQKKKYKCSECGGTNLLWQAWVDEFDNVQDDSGSDTWCDDCYTSDISVEEVSDE